MLYKCSPNKSFRHLQSACFAYSTNLYPSSANKKCKIWKYKDTSCYCPSKLSDPETLCYAAIQHYLDMQLLSQSLSHLPDGVSHGTIAFGKSHAMRDFLTSSHTESHKLTLCVLLLSSWSYLFQKCSAPKSLKPPIVEQHQTESIHYSCIYLFHRNKYICRK